MNFKVRCINNCGGGFIKGKTYKVENGTLTTEKGVIWTELHSLSEVNEELVSQFELVEEDMFAKKDLKVGYVVEFRSGKIKMIVDTQIGLVAASDNAPYDPIKSLTDNLKPNWSVENKFDVMKVYGFAETPSGALKISTSNRPLLWERKESPIEITLQEIADWKKTTVDLVRIKE